MRQILYIIIFLSFLSLSCREDEVKIQFIRDLINLPDDIETVIQNSKFDISLFQKNYFTDNEKKNDFISRLNLEIKKYYPDDFKITCNRERKEYDSESKDIRYYHEISISGNNEDRNILFRWSLLMNKWHLQDIIITGKVWCN